MFRTSVKGTGYPLHSPVSPFTSPPVRQRVPSHFNWTLSEARWGNDFCRGKATRISNTECVFVALFIRHEMRMCRIVLSSVACLVVPYFSTFPHKRHEFRKKFMNIKCILCLSDRAFLIQQYKQPTRCNNSNLLVNSISSTCFGR